MSGKGPIFHGWVIVAACFAIMFCAGEVLWSFGVFFTSLEQEFQWSRSMVSGGFTLLILGHAVATTVDGRLADRNATRPVLLVSAVLAGTAIALCSQIQNSTHFYVLFFVAGLGTGATTSVPISTVQRWFENRPHSGTALAIVMTGVGVGSVLSAPLFRYLIASQGWRSTFVFAGASFLVILASAGMLIRPHTPGASRQSDRAPEQTQPARALPVRKLVFTRQFLILFFVSVVSGLALQVLTVHLVPFATDSGVPPEIAAIALGLLGGASVPGRLLAGFIAERIGWSKSLVGAMVGCAAATACLMVINQGWALVGAVALFGICFGTRAVAVLGLLGRVFGTASLGELIGLNIALGQLLSAPGPYIVGYWFDLVNSYTATFAVLSVALALGAFSILRLGSSGPLNGASEQESSPE